MPVDWHQGTLFPLEKMQRGGRQELGVGRGQEGNGGIAVTNFPNLILQCTSSWTLQWWISQNKVTTATICMSWIIHIRISPQPSLYTLCFGENIPKKDQVAVQFCLTSVMGLVGSSSLITTSSSACFSLSFFFFFFLTGSPSSTAVPSVAERTKMKGRMSVIRSAKGKAMRHQRMQWLQFTVCVNLPAELLPAIIKI